MSAERIDAPRGLLGKTVKLGREPSPQIQFLNHVEHLTGRGITRLAAIQRMRTDAGGTDYPMTPIQRKGWVKFAPVLTHLNVAAFRRGAKRAKKVNVVGVWAFVLDDIGTKIKKEPGDKLDPTAVIQTRPGNQQYLYVLRAVCPLEDAERITKALATAGWCDPGGSRALQWFRLPGSQPPGKPAAAGLAGLSTKTYTPEDIVRAFELNLARRDTGVSRRARLRAAAARSPERPVPMKKLRGVAALTRATTARFSALARALGHLKRAIRFDKRRGLDIVCPWESEHTSFTGVGATTLLLPGKANGWYGSFYCCHAHCKGRGIHQLEAWVRGELANEKSKKTSG